MSRQRGLIAVNGRFAGRPVTGVERYAHELVGRLPRRSPYDIVLVEPPAGGGSGTRGHLWEQTVLPARLRHTGADLLLSPCNFGPLAVRQQVVIIYDVAPFILPTGFSRAYCTIARAVQPRLAHRSHVLTISERSRRDCAAVFALDPSTIGIIPAGVGPPFEPAPRPREPRCVFVGGHDPRKNLDFLLNLWPQVHRELDLELAVVARDASRTLQSVRTSEVPGVRWYSGLDDNELAELYRSSLFLLSPSRYEGFGLPLLEAMACGTPFFATDTGAAAELAPNPDLQVLPLDARVWIDRLRTAVSSGLEQIRDEGVEIGRRRTWDHATDVLADHLSAALPGREARARGSTERPS